MGQTGQKNILIVDDDASIRSLLREILNSDGHIVTELASAKEAAKICMQQNFDVIISDIRMPEMSGIELLQSLRKSKSTPFILMTGFSDILETQDAYNLGATDFLTKPFRKADLVGTIEHIFKPQSRSLDLDYYKINIEEFSTKAPLPSDIFVRLSDKKYLKVAQVGQILAPNKIIVFKNKGIDFLYLAKEDFLAYIGFNPQLSNIVEISEPPTSKERQNVISKITQVLEKEVPHALNQKEFEKAKEELLAIVNLLLEDKKLCGLLRYMESLPELFSHSVGVALYSLLLAKETQWKIQPYLFRVVVGGLLHDIGKKDLPPELLAKKRDFYTLEDRKIYESHVVKGRDLLNDIPSLPSEIVFIAMSHHENLMGSGYPFKIRGDHLHPFAKLVSIANEFCNLAMTNAHGQAMPLSQALFRLMTYHGDILDPHLLEVLANLLKIQIKSKGQRSRVS